MLGWGKVFVCSLVVTLFTISLFNPLLVSADSEEGIPIERVDQEYSILDSPCYWNFDYFGQTFVPTKPVLTSVCLALSFVGEEWDVNVTIYKAKENGYPNLTAPLTSVIACDYDSNFAYGDWYRFDFTDIPVTPGETYFIWADVANESGHGSWVVCDDGYQNGTSWSFLMDDDFGYEHPSTDFLFKTYYSDIGFNPVAEAGPDQEITLGLPVYFSGSESYDIDGSLVSYIWYFGDGTSSKSMNTSHVYGNLGTYRVSFTVTDNDGLTNTDFCNITIVEPPNVLPVPVIEIGGYLGHYYNLPCSHPEVGGGVSGIIPGDTPFNHDWYDDEYFSFSQIDSDLKFGADFFPVDEGLQGDPLYFAVHWETTINVPVSGHYSFDLGSDDDSWIYVDDEMVCDLGGIHAMEVSTYSVNLTEGEHQLDIYFAERRRVQSGFYFEFLNVDMNPHLDVFELEIPIQLVSNHTYKFNGTNSSDIDGDIISYEWTFGDSSSSAGPCVIHEYLESGAYQLVLNVTDNRNGSSCQYVDFFMVNSSSGDDFTLFTEYETSHTEEYEDSQEMMNIEVVDEVRVPIGIILFMITISILTGIAIIYIEE